MGKGKILMLDSLFFAEPFQWGIKARLQRETDLTLDLEKARKGLANSEYGLVVVEPWEFGNPKRKSKVLSVLEEARSRGVPVLVYSTQTLEVLEERCGVSAKDYTQYVPKVTTHPVEFYDTVSKLLNPADN